MALFGPFLRGSLRPSGGGGYASPLLALPAHLYWGPSRPLSPHLLIPSSSIVILYHAGSAFTLNTTFF